MLSSLQFEEQQQFRQPWVYLLYGLLAALLGLFIYADIEQIILGRSFGDKPASNIMLLVASVFILSLLFLLFQSKLETRINDEAVCFRWKPFQKRYKRLSWSEIEKAEIITYGFVGYGWRLTSYGTMYNVAGNTGLRLWLKSGKKLVLGTQKPSELAEFLQKIKAN